MLTSWKERYDQPRQHIEEQRHYFANKVHLVKTMVFPVVMYGCENWTIKKTEGWRLDAFELWCWRRLLTVFWISRRSHQSILMKINPGCSLVGLMLKLKLQYFGHPIWRADYWKRPWCWERLGAGEGDNGGWDGWMAYWLNGCGFGWTPGVGDWQGGLVCCSSWGRKELDMSEWLNWTELSLNLKKEIFPQRWSPCLVAISWLTFLQAHGL